MNRLIFEQFPCPNTRSALFEYTQIPHLFRYFRLPLYSYTFGMPFALSSTEGLATMKKHLQKNGYLYLVFTTFILFASACGTPMTTGIGALSGTTGTSLGTSLGLSGSGSNIPAVSGLSGGTGTGTVNGVNGIPASNGNGYGAVSTNPGGFVFPLPYNAPATPPSGVTAIAVGASSNPNAKRLYVNYNGDLFDYNEGGANEGVGQGWMQTGYYNLIFAQQTSSTMRPFYRCNADPMSHFMTMDVQCEIGQYDKHYLNGYVGYLETVQRPNTIPLYRCYIRRPNATPKGGNSYAHVTVRNPSDCTRAGSTALLEGIIGYGPASE